MTGFGLFNSVSFNFWCTERLERVISLSPVRYCYWNGSTCTFSNYLR